LNQSHKILWVLLFTFLFGLPSFVHAKKSTKSTNPRVKNLSGEDAQMFNALTKAQRKDISNGVIKEGYNAWMIKLALGEPYYGTEHHPIYKDYEQVWLYTKEDRDESVKEQEIVDPETNWPTIHKVTRIKSCTVGDFFVLFDRGVLEKVVQDTSEKIYGSCSIHTTEEFLPIVNSKTKGKK